MPGLPHPPVIDKGVIATIGIQSGNDRTAIVLPLISDDAGLTPLTRCNDAVNSLNTSIASLVQACLAANANISFIQAEGMIDGDVPFRTDFSAATYPGTAGSVVMPNNVAGLIVFYGDPADLAPGERMPVGKNFMPGVPAAEVTGDIISNTLFLLYEALASALRSGFATQLGGGKWFRVAGKGDSRTAGTTGVGSSVAYTRNYVATQRRRLIPH